MEKGGAGVVREGKQRENGCYPLCFNGNMKLTKLTFTGIIEFLYPV